MAKIFQVAAKVNDLSNLGIGEPDFHTEPEIVDAAAKAGKEGFTHLSSFGRLSRPPGRDMQLLGYKIRYGY
jgi:aspartate/methionine/tyrosine aminotransferase